LFLAAAAAAVMALQVAHGVFPGDRAVAQIGRLLCSIAGIVLLVIASRWLLARDGIPANRLGLDPGGAHVKAFLLGGVAACAHILALVVALYAVTPFQLERGPLPLHAAALAGLGYLTGNFVEELLFRGYLLIVLARWLGTTRAIWLLALPFGLFHMPGLDTLALGKMIMTTGAMHFVYVYAFLATRSLWCAVALHAVGNTLLHAVFGVGQLAVLSVRFTRELPTGVDAPFIVFFGISVAFAILLSRLPATRSGAAWLESMSRNTR
jgi:uncharacterized protein